MELKTKGSSYRLPSTSTSTVHPQITEEQTVTTDPVFNKQRRLVFKNGECNVKNVNIPKRALSYLADHFTTFLEQRWRIVIIVFFSCFFVSWFLFTLAWFTLATLHDDFSAEHDPGFIPCIWNVNNFASVFLFSMETQTTIGYGYRYVSEECGAGVFFLVLQSVFGALLQSVLAGAVVAKLLMPKKRAKTVLFSKRCCVCVENGQLCLMFRVGNLRQSPIFAASIRAFFLWHDDMPDDNMLAYRLQEMQMDQDEITRMAHLWWPNTMIHRITKSSPLYNISNKTLKTRRFEIIVILEGSVASTSLTFQARTSYLETDIVWGYRFVPLFKPMENFGSKYPVDFMNFDEVYKVQETPTHCAKEQDENQNERVASRRKSGRRYSIVE
ncbi:ATP-sensitive inward rectifier potassium channel 12-like [Gigantopelta aegis]|uniref:ATP-sensitive inward rectifier potassium channel 12-like n=1 Tax=Gigantopelta aegis TaxID=1735272 RepID=UPI001B88D2C6|nr:ATP-sensitive inward rectifier potassium channel 12-like [Gigantopelta aegis]